jgi:hypothetical protein
MTQTRQELSNTIYRALGANKFKVMTGAKNFVINDLGLSFTIPNIGNCSIQYDEGLDLFNMEFFKIRKFEKKVNKEFNGLYVDQLEEIFSEHTGLATSL